jgi:hypothetical protein
LLRRGGFGEDAGAGGDDRIRRDDQAFALDAGQFFGGESQGVLARKFFGVGGLVDIGCDDLVRLDTDLPQKLQPPGAGGSEDYLKRNVIRPLVRS